jgi:hypothetical protein
MPFPGIPRRLTRNRGSRRFGTNLDILAWVALHKRRPRRGRDLDDGGVPVEPDKPRTLSGGAAAALEFDEDASA